MKGITVLRINLVWLGCFLFVSSPLPAIWDAGVANDAYAFPEYHHEEDIPAWCPPDHPYQGEMSCDGCYELFVHYEPCCYTTCSYVEEQVPYQKRCMRYVDKLYEVRRYRYVPEYYNVTIVQREPEYYLVEETKPCVRRVEHVEYGCTPQYYWKPVCYAECCPEQ